MNTFCEAREDNNDPPGLTVGDFSSSPLISILASPCGNNFFSAKPSIVTNTKIITEKTKIDENTVNSIIIYIYSFNLKFYNCIPEKERYAIDNKPVKIIVMPSPFKPSGISEYLNLKRIAAILTIAK